ncbi:thiamine pyrophosphate-dependent enzyme [Oceanicella actignis]|uniref:Acetolactate synthase-1/2/3 large subunit n=1 Tax=Oceanicella actignis TaxID=1189325 RepID=A0A1M7SGU7_9RHOB|nr:thiamine pyrophosphate-dependent enzyme [Oceanicella actignis]TYO91256.1 acetolactate synthase-1/2/3 large subunit [Oceanicella actignis]SET20791.1 acetolactate synthase-1/2/3 large subunit [Oceanicella actignis]SHN57664.1 acetolactate synthase-1/2/3 large subunit [Oceanicella actignis]
MTTDGTGRDAPTGGRLLVECLRAQGVERVFCVPGESYLEALDALGLAGVETVNARHEGAAAMMAEADGKLTGRPGVAFVTRGPGATNAAAGVHVAMQDGTPMVLFVGQIGRAMRGRAAFQEVDYRQTFRDLAKWVEEIDDAARIPEIVSHAWHIAMSGRPGPVVLALPEDMLRDPAPARPGPRVEVADPAPDPAAMARMRAVMAAAERPLVIVGGSRWDAAAREALHRLAAEWDVPVAVTFRRQMLFDATHPNYAGDLGLGANPALVRRAAEADAVLMIGARFSENPSQGFSLFDIPAPRQRLIHVHPAPDELGRIYVPEVAVNATPRLFLEAALAEAPPRRWSARAENAAYRAWTDAPPEDPGALTMSRVIAHMREVLPPDAVLTNGAGNYAIWLHRFYRWRAFGTQLAPVSGSMGYGLPAAIAAKLRDPAREVFCLAGDGCFQMTGLELATAAQTGASVVTLICDNGMYGTIRMHQERRFPGRAHATSLRNPDFAALARACGAWAETVARDEDFPAAFERARAHARAAKGPAALHLRLDPRALAPGRALPDAG